jgi:hypothetical protein
MQRNSMPFRTTKAGIRKIACPLIHRGALQNLIFERDAFRVVFLEP